MNNYSNFDCSDLYFRSDRAWNQKTAYSAVVKKSLISAFRYFGIFCFDGSRNILFFSWSMNQYYSFLFGGMSI